MKKNTLFFNALFSVMLCLSFSAHAQESDFDNDGIIDRLDVDDDNDGIRDAVECPPISGAAIAKSDKISWELNQFKVFTIGGNTNGLGYQESGFQKEVYDRGQPLTVLNGALDYTFTQTTPGTATTTVGTFANGTLDFEHNYLYRAYQIHQFRTTTAGAFTSGNGPSNGLYVYPEVGNQTGDYYTVNINFTQPVASFSFDFVDIYDTNTDPAVMNYEVYADGNLVAYFSNTYIGNDAIGNINLYDANGTLRGSLQAGQNIESTIGFVTSDAVSQVSIRHIAVSGGLAASTHDPHGLDSLAYSFLCELQLDIDVDDDGIPDNVEAQTTAGYLAPSNVVNTSGANIGLYTNYGSGFIPVNTDGTDLPDYLDTDTDNDGVLDIEENGHASSIVNGSDTDGDGLDNNFDDNSSSYDVNDEVTTGNIIDLVNSFGDMDNDATTGGDVDYRDNATEITASSTIDFDGVDDYLIVENLELGGQQELTLSAWIKLDNGFSTSGDVAGQNMFRIWVDSSKKVHGYFIGSLSNTSYQMTSNYTLPNNEWHQVTMTYSGSAGTLKLYIDGKLDTQRSVPIGTTSIHPTFTNPDFTIGRFERFGNSYFFGSIDEVRVFNKALTEDQLQRMVYQEIEEKSNKVSGSVINDKDIIDINTNVKIDWSSLIGYYPMSHVMNGIASDYSSYGRDAKLKNIRTIQDQTAPLPYQTSSNGSWTSESTWLYGDVWDIENLPNNNWSIVKINNNVTTTNSHTNLGLIISANKKLTVNGSNAIVNTWYLELDGTLDLQNESQLIQTEHSELEVTSAGKILRRQEGLNNVYRYNYWSSPVGGQSITSNNTSFSLNMLKEANGNIQFTNAYTPPATTPATISTYWLYTFKNGVTYYDWASIDQNSSIEPGVGYTQKGTGVGTTDFQYIFEGKPNNGEILINVNDAGGTGSVGGVSKTEYLVGNPYPSALDINEFILDNSTVINGAVYLWEQWAGDSHVLNQYQGGYATLNLAGGVRAYQFSGLNGANNGSQDGVKTPERYIPVGQGFMTEIVGNGTLKFENDQRAFRTEASGTSVFMRTNGVSNESPNANNHLEKIRLEFSTSNNLNRELLLVFSNNTSDEEFDYGYDAKVTEEFANDFLSTLNNDKYAIQAFGPIQSDKQLDLVLKSDGTQTFTVKLTEVENIDANQGVYLYDSVIGVYHDLRSGAYNFSAPAGEDFNRFKIVFEPNETLSNQEFETVNDISIFINNFKKQLFVKGLNQDIKTINLINVLGQNVMQLSNIDAYQASSGISLNTLSTGVYIVDVTLKDGRVLSKKVTVN
ncbi:LamG-like jellyroll fold domain-containing protein [Olleya aquimaris]|uniref:Putative secreted protein (Por secretion system target) n=1 Tax=Olleya aquimaris TaxID=639310 RepID=A0A327RDW5_9FLAO|nr:LamG-like jellyroll fold domain-containing protein [Olleya aquimaris]RAJ15170.1 putative secreted protein (Por secretion system target) [Olleya aquimaris]